MLLEEYFFTTTQKDVRDRIEFSWKEYESRMNKYDEINYRRKNVWLTNLSVKRSNYQWMGN